MEAETRRVIPRHIAFRACENVNIQDGTKNYLKHASNLPNINALDSSPVDTLHIYLNLADRHF